MALSHFIAHRIHRPSPTSAPVTTLRESEFDLNGKIEECARELKLSYIKKLGKIHGRFSSDRANHPSASWIDECISEKLSFISLTHQAMSHFKICLEKTECPLDAHIFFAKESFEHADELYIYIVHHCSGLYLDGDINMSDSIYLDTNHVKLACKLNLREWQDDDNQLNYLSLLPWRGEKDLSDSFSDFCGFTDKADIKEQTENFLDAVESYANELPEEKAVEARETVVNYCLEQDKAGKRVVISELADQVNESGAKDFAQHVKTQKPELTSELIPDRAQLRQYIRISGRDELLSMSFDSKCLGDAIVYDHENESLTINKIPSALKTRLLKHLRQTN